MNDFTVRLRRRNIPEEELLADLKRAASALSKRSITKIEYDANGRFGATTILRRFKQWNLALERADLEAPNRQHIPDTELFENLASVWTTIGCQPLGRDLDKTRGAPNFSLGVYEKRFGSWNNALLAFEAFMKLGVRASSLPAKRRPAHPNRRSLKKINWRLRAQVLIRDNCICRMCGASPAKDPRVSLHADHIKPWSKGGETTLDNLRTLCATCNIGKSDLYDEVVASS